MCHSHVSWGNRRTGSYAVDPGLGGRASSSLLTTAPVPSTGMNAAVRAVVRMGIYVGAKVFFIYEVSACFPFVLSLTQEFGLPTGSEPWAHRSLSCWLPWLSAGSEGENEIRQHKSQAGINFLVLITGLMILDVLTVWADVNSTRNGQTATWSFPSLSGCWSHFLVSAHGLTSQWRICGLNGILLVSAQIKMMSWACLEMDATGNHHIK